MKRPLTRSEKWLWATPLLLGIVAAILTVGPRVARLVMGWPQTLSTMPGTQIRSMALSRNGAVVAAGGSMMGTVNGKTGWKRGSGTVSLWNARTGERIAPFIPIYTRDRNGYTYGWDVWGLTLSPNGNGIGFSRVGQSWTLYDVATHRQLWRYSQFIGNAQFSADGHFIALSGDGGGAITNAIDGRVRTRWKYARYSYSPDIAMSPDGSWVAYSIDSHTEDAVEVRRAESGRLAYHLKVDGANSVAFSPDGKRLVIGCALSNWSGIDFNNFAPVRCCNVTTGVVLWEVKSPAFGEGDTDPRAFCDVVFSPDGRLVAAYEERTGKVFLLDGSTGAIRATLKTGSANTDLYVPPGLAFAPDGKRLYARGKDAVLFWDLK